MSNQYRKTPIVLSTVRIDIIHTCKYFTSLLLILKLFFNADDHNLAYISKMPGSEDIPYFNASVVAAYTAQQYFVLAQDPIPQNIQLFWRCVIDNDIKCVVMIGDVSCNVLVITFSLRV